MPNTASIPKKNGQENGSAAPSAFSMPRAPNTVIMIEQKKPNAPRPTAHTIHSHSGRTSPSIAYRMLTLLLFMFPLLSIILQCLLCIPQLCKTAIAIHQLCKAASFDNRTGFHHIDLISVDDI